MPEESKVLCPWCFKGEVYVEGTGKVSISVKCPRCSRCFKARLDDLTAIRIQPHKRINISQGVYHRKDA